jgi:hypothetical protein
MVWPIPTVSRLVSAAAATPRILLGLGLLLSVAESAFSASRNINGEVDVLVSRGASRFASCNSDEYTAIAAMMHENMTKANTHCRHCTMNEYSGYIRVIVSLF